MGTLVQDLRSSFRQLWKAKGFATLAIVTLALGIGANTALFTIVNAVLLRPLPYLHSNRLVAIEAGTKLQTGQGTTSWLNYRDICDQSHVFAAVAGYSSDVSVVETKDRSISVVAPHVTPNTFPMLGAQPLLGRTFTEAEGQPNGEQSVIISEGLWRSSFHSDPNVLGKAVRVGGIPRTIVGVMPESFRFPEEMGHDITDGVWLPIQPTGEMLNDRGYHFFSIIGQLRPGVSIEQARADLSQVSNYIARVDPKNERGLRFVTGSYQEMLTGPVRPVFYGLLGALALLLLIACANVANLLIARCIARRHEFAVRAALGAGRARLVRQMLTEGAVLSLLGCGFGFALVQIILIGVSKLPPDTIPSASYIAVHWNVVLLLAAIATFTTVVSSIAPAFLAGRTDPQPALQAGSRGVGSRSASGRLTRALVIAEVALATVLLCGTGLLFHTLWNLEHTRLGFDVSRITTFTAMPADAAGFSNLLVSPDIANAPTSVGVTAYAPVLNRIRHSPGVEDAALATAPPLSGVQLGTSFEVLGRPKDPGHELDARITAVSGDYGKTLGTAVVRGRMITDDDNAAAPYVIVINETLAKQFFPNEDPLQHQIDLGGKDTGMLRPYTIIGVIADQTDDKVGQQAHPMLFVPYQQVPTTSLFYPALLKTIITFVVKTRGDVPVAPEMRSIFHDVAPNYALDNFKAMREIVSSHIFSERLGLYLIAAFAGLAVVMVVAGLYGVLAQLVSYRRREIGIRMALGATRESMAYLVLKQGSVLLAGGLVAGLVLAALAGRLITGFLYNVRPLDLLTYGAVVFIALLIGTMASLIPARRAATVEPIQALRED
ncbi:MAG: ABC transporter permease [Terriglobia bacterium]|jgi:predicted permease|nr:ABC transporter permease [Terriglobia bacterium]